MAKDYVASFSAAQGTDVLHFGVRGMKWGIRNADHGASTSHVKRQGTGTKRGLVSDFTVSPYRSAGRIRFGKTTFNQLKPKQQSKLEKSLARDLGKTLEKKLPKTARGKIDYLSTVKNNPKLRDSLIKKHGGLLTFAKRDVGNENKRQYITTHSNYPRILTFGTKTNFALNTLGISAIVAKAFSKHSDEIDANDYLGTIRDQPDDIEHFGVRGMKWGIRNDSRSSSSGSSGKTKPTRAKVKEDKARADAKTHAALKTRIEKIKAGTGRPLVMNGKVLSRAESVKHLERQAAKLAPKTKDAPKPTEAKPEAPGTLYTQLTAKAKEKGVSSLTDDELKYLNGRTEALSKAKKLITEPDSWLVATVKNAVKTAAKEKIDAFAKAGATNFFDKVKASQEKAKTKKASRTAKAAQGFPLKLPRREPTVHNITTLR